MPNAVLGVQTPRVSSVPKIDDLFHVERAIVFAAGYGLIADQWQRIVLNSWLGMRRGKWACPRCGLSVPRQNGKNGALEIRELYGMVALGEKFLHTAHEVKTARKAFLRLMYFFGEQADDPNANFPELNALVKEVRKTNGQEAIILTNGGSIEFIARSKGSGRGFTVDVLVLDEAQELSDDTLAALRPTISSAPLKNPQIILTGTPPSPVMNGEVFTRYRKNGAKGTDKRLSWLEWSAPPKSDPADRSTWAQANPSLGYRLSIDICGDEFDDMDAETFDRERRGMWDEAGTSALFGMGRWEACCVESLQGGPQGLGVAVSMNRAFACISAASFEGGRLQIKPLRHGRGTGWIAKELQDLLGEHDVPIAIDERGPAADLIEQLEKPVDEGGPGLTIERVSTAQYLDLNARLYDEAQEPDGTLAHPNHPALNSAVGAAIWRKVGKRQAVGARNLMSDDITALESSIVAIRAADVGADYDTDDSIY